MEECIDSPRTQLSLQVVIGDQLPAKLCSGQTKGTPELNESG